MTESKTELTIKNDMVFQIIFGVSQNIELTIDLLKAILESEGKSTKITNPVIQTEVSLEKLKLREKGGRLDVRLETDERIYCIEMQNKNSINLYKRGDFYKSRQMSSQIKEGQKYKDLKPITMIFIINGRFNKKYDKNYKDFKEHIITVNKKCREMHIDLGFDFIFLYLSEYKKVKKHDMNVPINQWISLLNYNNEEELKMAMKLNKNVEKANEEFLKLKEEREAERMRELEETYWIEKYFAYDEGVMVGREDGIEIGEKRGKKIGEKRGIAIGEKRGKKDGIKIGEKKEKKVVAKKLLLQKVDEQIILSATGLSKKEFEELKKAI